MNPAQPAIPHRPQEDDTMTAPEWLKPGLTGAVIGAIAVAIAIQLGGW